MNDLFSLPKGLRQRDIGMEAAAYSYGAAEWLEKARAVAKILAMTNGETNACEVLRQCPRPASVSPNATGSIFKGKAWRCVGHVKTEKVSGRGREIKRWMLSGE